MTRSDGCSHIPTPCSRDRRHGAGPEARYSQSEAIELAFVAGLQRMPPRQAAAVLLRDVLGFGTDEVAAMLKTSPTAIKELCSVVVRRYGVRATQLTAACRYHGRPKSASSHGALPMRTSLPTSMACSRCSLTTPGCLCLPRHTNTAAWPRFGPFWRPALLSVANGVSYLIPGRANNQSSFASYLSDQQEPVARPAGLFVLTLADDHILALTRFHYDDLYPLLGFPASLTLD